MCTTLMLLVFKVLAVLGKVVTEVSHVRGLWSTEDVVRSCFH